MSEPKRRGRPKKSSIPESNTQNNQQPPQPNQSSDNRNTVFDEEDDLKSFLKNKSKVSDNKSNNSSIDEEALKEIEEFDKTKVVDDIPSEEFNPLNEPVMQRTYTGGINNDFARNYAQERIIEEPQYKGGGATNLDVDKDLINPNNDIPDPNPNYQRKNNQQQQQQQPQSEGTARPLNEVEDENLKNLSTKEKREAVEKTADAILLAYRNYVPLPFVYFSSYDNKKLEQLHKKDEINLDTQVKRDGTTFREYTKTFNDNVEAAFTVTDAEVEALKDPLVDVLMEKEIALTPTQRLLFTAGQLLVAKVMLSVKFLREKKSDIEEMKTIHQERMDALREQIEREERRGRTGGAKATSTTPPPPTSQEPKLTVVPDDDDDNEDDDAVSDAKIIREEKNNEKTEPSLDDVLNLDNEQDDNDIPD